MSKETVYPGALDETIFVQGYQVGIRAGRYPAFAWCNASNRGRYLRCHTNGLRPSKAAESYDVSHRTVERQNASGEGSALQPYCPIAHGDFASHEVIVTLGQPCC